MSSARTIVAPVAVFNSKILFLAALAATAKGAVNGLYCGIAVTPQNVLSP